MLLRDVPSGRRDCGVANDSETLLTALTSVSGKYSTGERDKWGHQMADYTAESWDRVRAVLVCYGVDIGPREGKLSSDTNLVTLASARSAVPGGLAPGRNASGRAEGRSDLTL